MKSSFAGRRSPAARRNTQKEGSVKVTSSLSIPAEAVVARKSPPRDIKKSPTRPGGESNLYKPTISSQTK